MSSTFNGFPTTAVYDAMGPPAQVFRGKGVEGSPGKLSLDSGSGNVSW